MTTSSSPPPPPSHATVGSSQDHLYTLPDELVAHICSLVDSDPLDLYRLSLCSRRLRRVATSASPWQNWFLTWWSGISDDQHPRPEYRQRHNIRKRKLREWVQQDERRNSRQNQAQSPLYSIDGLLAPLPVPENQAESPAEYYDICRTRLNTEDYFLKRARHHVNLKHGRLVSALDILHQGADQLKEILHLLLWDQTLTSTPNGPRHFARAKLTTKWPTAREIHLRAVAGTPKPHTQYHLALSDLAKTLLGHLQRRDALDTCRDLRDEDFELDIQTQAQASTAPQASGHTLTHLCHTNAIGLEAAIVAVTHFRRGEKRQITEYLDLLAVYIYLKLRSHPEPLPTTRSVVAAIFEYLAQLSFATANPVDFLDLDNSFLHISLFCPHNRATLPLTLMAIFVSIATRLGIPAGISNLPGRIIAVVVEQADAEDDVTAAARAAPPSSFFFVDGSRIPADSPIREPQDSVEWSQMVGLPRDATFASTDWAPATGAAILRRMSQNILNAVRNGQAVPRIFHAVGLNNTNTNNGAQASSHATGSTPTTDDHQPRPVDILHDYLSSHVGRATATSSLPPELQPLRAHHAHTLPTSRPTSLDSDTSREATYCAGWLLAEFSPDSLGQAEMRWVADSIEAVNALDIAATAHGAKEARKNASRQRNLTAARHRQRGQPLGLYGNHPTHEGQFDEDDIVPWFDVGRGSGLSTGSSEDDNDSDSDGASSSSGSSGSSVMSIGTIGSSDSMSRSVRAQITGKTYASRLDEHRWFALLAPRLFSQDIALPQPCEHRSTGTQRPSTVTHTVGTLFEHRAYGYRAVITGWDEQCKREEVWISQMGVDNLPDGGRRQPFYYASVEDGSHRYVAQCNVRSVSRLRTDSDSDDLDQEHDDVLFLQNFASLLAVRGIGAEFRAVDLNTRRLRKSKMVRAVWGNEGSDDEDDGNGNVDGDAHVQ